MSVGLSLPSQQYIDEVRVLVSNQEVPRAGTEASADLARMRYESLARLTFLAVQLTPAEDTYAQ